MVWEVLGDEVDSVLDIVEEILLVDGRCLDDLDSLSRELTCKSPFVRWGLW